MTTNPVLDRPVQAAKKTVLVVDDHPLMRQGLALLINQQQDMQVCGEAEEVQAAMLAIARLHPDIVILDISLSGPDGLELLKSIRATNPGLPVLILSMHDEAIYAERALRAGGCASRPPLRALCFRHGRTIAGPASVLQAGPGDLEIGSCPARPSSPSSSRSSSTSSG